MKKSAINSINRMKGFHVCTGDLIIIPMITCIQYKNLRVWIGKPYVHHRVPHIINVSMDLRLSIESKCMRFYWVLSSERTIEIDNTCMEIDRWSDYVIKCINNLQCMSTYQYVYLIAIVSIHMVQLINCFWILSALGFHFACIIDFLFGCLTFLVLFKEFSLRSVGVGRYRICSSGNDRIKANWQ